jgi:hypothetical protein
MLGEPSDCLRLFFFSVTELEQQECCQFQLQRCYCRQWQCHSQSQSFDRNVFVRTQLDSNRFNCKSGGIFRPQILVVVIIKICAHVVIVVGLHVVATFELMIAGLQTHCAGVMQSLL